MTDTYGNSPEFHVYTKQWVVPTGWASKWSELVADLVGFNTRRGVRDWWLGLQAGTATLDFDFIGEEYPFSGWEVRPVTKVQITVDVPAGEKELFTGFVVATEKTFNAAGFPIFRAQLVDHVGWSAQQVVPAVGAGGGTPQTGDILRSQLLNNQAGYEAADIANLAAGVGLVQRKLYPASNLLDLMNTYLRGELAVMWVHADGTWRYAMRGWWNPLGNPVATIGSLTRGVGGTYTDPSLTEAAIKFPATVGRFGAKVTYTSFTWTGVGIGPSTSALYTGGIGTRQWTDTLHLTVLADLINGRVTLANVIPNYPPLKDVYDDSATLTIHAEHSTDSLNYCAVADVTDFVEVAKETQQHIDGRWWVPGHVMGVSHSFSVGAGWDTTLRLDLGLAEADWDPFPD